MLINLVSIHPQPSPQSTPLAAAFLKAYALKSAVSIGLVDFFLEDDVASCTTKLAATFPDAVGFSLYVWNRRLSCAIADELRREHPEIKIFCGGPEATADPESVLSTGLFDFVIVGEGEVPFASFCHALASGGEYADIPGILLPGTAHLPPPAPISALDTIPSPYLTGVIDSTANPGILWQLSRGCSFSCDFCYDARGIHGVRHFSLERVEAEVRHFAATGVSQVFVLDSTFNIDRERAKKILRIINKHAPDIHFHFEVRSEFIDREMAELFARLACSLQIGLQSADRHVLELVGRTFNKADFSAKVGILNETGAVFGFDLIYGLPGDTIDGFRHSLDYALSLYPNHLDIFPLAVLPGTRLASRGAALNLRWDTKAPYVLQATDSFDVADMATAADLAAACDIFYTRGKAVAWFNAVVAVMGMKPSNFLQKFGDWIAAHKDHEAKESDFSDEDIWEMQRLFLKHIFSGNKLKRYLPLVLDLAAYHFHYAAVLLAPLPESDRHVNVPANKCDTGFRLARSARTIHFTYEIEELLDFGEPNIRKMYETLRQSGSQAVLYINGGTLHTESLDLTYILLLEQIRDHDGRIDLPETGLTSNEAEEFIVFALQEGILVKEDK